MGLTLHLGVLDVTYSDASSDASTTTFKVASILEKNFGVMGAFYSQYQSQIAGWLAEDMASSLKNLVNSGGQIRTGGRLSSANQTIAGIKRTVSGDQSGSLTFGADQKIERAFRAFIFGSEMAKMNRGVQLSGAAVAGQSKRFKSGYTRGRKPRPAFVDTGLYVSSFRAFVTQ